MYFDERQRHSRVRDVIKTICGARGSLGLADVIDTRTGQRIVASIRCGDEAEAEALIHWLVERSAHLEVARVSSPR